jgi:hypothetical protein
MCDRFIDLPADIRDASSILKLKSGKASAMKAKHTTQEVSVGPLMEVETTHADGQPVKLRLQVCAHAVIRFAGTSAGVFLASLGSAVVTDF